MSGTRLNRINSKDRSFPNLSNKNNPAQNVGKDLLFKMSKKIAQLTKVIYYLNTKNEDSSLRIQLITDEYENELKETVADGATVINELQMKLAEQEAIGSRYEKNYKVNILLIKKLDGEISSYLSTIAEKDATIANQIASLAEKDEAFQRKVDEHNETIKNLQKKNEAAIKM
jgi:vacuolar-type H+-ATPase subunit I/STV1